MAVGTFVLYHYDPSFIAAAIFIALFSLSGAYHAFQLSRFKTWYFIPFLIGCTFEAFGYVGRAWSAKQTPNWATLPYAMQSLLLLLGPTLLAASIYMILGRLIRLLEADGYSLIRPARLTKFFVLGDVLSFLTQSGGGGMLSNAKTQEAMNMGENIIMGGLIIQIIFFGFFMVVTVIFHRRNSASPTPKSLTLSVPWQRYLMILYAASMMIMVRSIFRVAEYAGGFNGPLQSTEVYIYIFDATLMFLVSVMFNVFHPSIAISSEKNGFQISNTEERIEFNQLYPTVSNHTSSHWVQRRSQAATSNSYNSGHYTQ